MAESSRLDVLSRFRWPEQRWIRWTLLFTGATLLGFIESSRVQFDRALYGDPITWEHALRHGLPQWYTWAALTPLILWITRILRRRGLGPGQLAAAHLLAGATITLLQIALLALLSNLLHRGTDVLGHLGPAFFKYLNLQFLAGMLTYGVIIASESAVSFYRRYREHERAAAQLDLQASELKALLAEARLRQLQSQLQPPFLFNTLHALSALMLKGETTTAVRMTSRLSELLRDLLRTEKTPEIPLRREIELLERYLAIERLRFGDRLHANIDVEPSTERGLVPALLLQPLVENAIRHGIEADPSAQQIGISARRNDDRLVLIVRDDGPGFDIARSEGAAGVGLRNTRARLEGLYGIDAELRVEEAPGGGAEVWISLPFRAAGDSIDSGRPTISAEVAVE